MRKSKEKQAASEDGDTITASCTDISYCQCRDHLSKNAISEEPLLDSSHINNPDTLPIKENITDKYSKLSAPRENTKRLIPTETRAPTDNEDDTVTYIEDVANLSSKMPLSHDNHVCNTNETKFIPIDSKENLTNLDKSRRDNLHAQSIGYNELEAPSGKDVPYIRFSIPVSTTWTEKRFSSHDRHFSNMKKLDKMYTFDYSDIIDMPKYLNLRQPLPNIRHSWSEKGGMSIKKEIFHNSK